jgi:hypothetical protein
MTIFRLLPVFLILLQSGRATAHAHTDPAGHAEAPHVHICELFALFGPLHGDEDSHDGADHDHDVVDLSAWMTSAAPPVIEHGTLDLALVEARPAFEATPERLSFPVGLPPSTAGPHRPLYLTFCTLTI